MWVLLTVDQSCAIRSCRANFIYQGERADIFFLKQETAYEMRISDWSSDVCSSDLVDLFMNRNIFSIARGQMLRGLVVSHIKLFLSFRTLTDEIGRASCRERVCQYV